MSKTPKRSRPSPLFFDSVSISNFALTRRLDILERRYRGRGAVTTQVMDEIGRGVTAGYGKVEGVYDFVDGRYFRVVVLSRDERVLYRRLLARLGEGEASTIAAALERSGTVVTDDRAARNVCRELEIALSGTIGILVGSVRDGMLTHTAADEILDFMVEADFHSPVRRISDIV